MTTATGKILVALRDTVAAALPGISIHIDRSDQEPLDSDELPAVSIRLFDFGFDDDWSQGQWTWNATAQFDCHARTETGTDIDEHNRGTIATIMAALWNACDGPGANTHPLGRLVQRMQPVMTDPTEQDAPDVGWAVLQYRVQFFTPPGQADVIVGVGGQLF